MTEPTPPKGTFSDEELASMRREVLRWLEMEKERGSSPPPAGESPKRVVRKKRTATRTKTFEPTLPVKEKKQSPTATKQPDRIAASNPALLPRPTATVRRKSPPRVTKIPEVAKKPDGKINGLLPEPRIRPKRTPRPVYAMAFLLVSAGLFTATLVFLVGTYRYGWSHPIVKSIARIFPLPAAYAGDETLRLSDFLNESELLARSAAAQHQNLTAADIHRKVIANFTQRVAFRRLASRLNITVTPAESQRQLDALIQELGSPERLAAELANNFPGWSIEDFRRRLLEPYLLRQAVQTQVLTDPTSWRNAEQQANDIRNKILAKEMTFADAVARYNRDERVSSDGDLGFRGANDLDPALFAAASALGVNEISPPVRSVDGYHLLMVLEHLSGATPGEERIHVLHILLPPNPSLETLLAQELQTFSVRTLVP
ncbi:MAG: peptidylprolyl isomerase [Patescibacteria group bacterium]|nr:peptidylprolyl isomerase [Patescibacteria group bacterium]